MGCSRRRLGCAASLRADVSASRFSGGLRCATSKWPWHVLPCLVTYLVTCFVMSHCVVMLIHFGSFCLSRSQLRRGEDCPRARSLGPALRDPFSSTATIERAKETRAVQIRNRTDHHFDCACYVCGNPVRQTKLFLAASMDGSLVPSCSLPAEVRSPELENQGNVGNAPTERYPRDKVSKLDSGNIQQSLHSAVGNFLSLLGIPQYADQFMDLGLENLVTLSRLGRDSFESFELVWEGVRV